MSKMSQLYAELSEQANELGFETIQDAVNSGYIVDYEKGKLVKYGLGYSETVEYLTKEQEKAHEAWLKERDHAIEILDLVADVLKEINDGLVKTGDEELIEAWSLLELARETRAAAKFIKEQCHD